MKLGFFVAFFLLLAAAGVPSSHALHLAVIDTTPTVMDDDAPAFGALRVDGAVAASLPAESAAAAEDAANPDRLASSNLPDTGIFTLLIAGVASMAYVARRR